MSEKRHNLGHAMGNAARRQSRPVDQDHRNPEASGGIQFRPRTGAAGILGDYEVHTAGFQKFPVALLRERAARDHRLGVRQRQPALRRIDQPQNVVMPGLRGEGRQVLATDGKEDASGFLGQSRDSSGEVGDMSPVIAFACLPRRALIGAKRRIRVCTGGNCIPAHLGREGMGRIHHMGYAFGAQICGKAIGTTETADAGRQGLFHGGVGAPGIGKDGINALGREVAGKLACLTGAAEKKDACHG